MKLILSIFLIIFLSSCGSEPSADEQAWTNQGFTLESRKPWLDLELNPIEAKTLVKLGLTPKKSKKWLKKGFSIDQIKLWIKVSKNPKDVKPYFKNQLTPDDYIQYKDIKVSPEDLKKYLDANYIKNYIVFYTDLGFKFDDIKTYYKKPQEKKSYIYKSLSTSIYNFEDTCKDFINFENLQSNTIKTNCMNFIEKSRYTNNFGLLIEKKRKKDKIILKDYRDDLRDLKSQSEHIFKLFVEEFDYAIDNNNSDIFMYLFPLMDGMPTKKEMDYIYDNSIQMNDDKRYLTYDDAPYWIKSYARELKRRESIKNNKVKIAKIVDKPKVVVVIPKVKKTIPKKKVVVVVPKAKKAVPKKVVQVPKAKKIVPKKVVQIPKKPKVKVVAPVVLKPKTMTKPLSKSSKACAKNITYVADNSNDVRLNGDVVFTIEKPGRRLYGIAIKNANDGKLYFVRDPLNKSKISGNYVDWVVKPSRRAVKISNDDDLPIYDKDDGDDYPMSEYIQECK